VKYLSFGINIPSLIAVGIMITAMYYPWWSLKLEYMDQTDIYPYLVAGPLSDFVGYKKSPQMALLTNILIASIGLGFIGSFMRRWAGRIMLGFSGIISLYGTYRLLMRLEDVASRFDVPLQGKTFASYSGFAIVEVISWLQPGTYLMIIGSVIILLAAVVQTRIRFQINFSG
jgi:hypothetical protein